MQAMSARIRALCNPTWIAKRSPFGPPFCDLLYLPGGEAGAANATEVAKRTIEHFIDEWQERGFGPWAVIEKASQNLLGHCGLRYLPEFDAVEVLYALDDSAWGKEVATEAAMASLNFGFTQLNLERIIALALPENGASRRVMEKISLQYVKMTMFKGYEVVFYEILHPGDPA